jgi:SAM-dependent methyltransferase
MNQYILPHNLAGERQRLGLMSELLDPLHRSHIEQLGLQAGWRCLEVGCGNGSMSEWLANRVAPGGHVVATDIDTRYIASLVVPNLEVRQLNILEDAVEDCAYDLVTARAVLHHIESPEKAVRRMLGVLTFFLALGNACALRSRLLRFEIKLLTAFRYPSDGSTRDRNSLNSNSSFPLWLKKRATVRPVVDYDLLEVDGKPRLKRVK